MSTWVTSYSPWRLHSVGTCLLKLLSQIWNVCYSLVGNHPQTILRLLSCVKWKQLSTTKKSKKTLTYQLKLTEEMPSYYKMYFVDVLNHFSPPKFVILVICFVQWLCGDSLIAIRLQTESIIILRLLVCKMYSP